MLQRKKTFYAPADKGAFSGKHKKSNRIDWKRHRAIAWGTCLALTLAAVSVFVFDSTEVDAKEGILASAQTTNDSYGMVTLYAPEIIVPRGSRIERVKMRELLWPRDRVPSGAVRTQEELQGMFAERELMPNQPVLRSQLAKQLPTAGIQELLATGYRGATLEVDAAAGVEGWATPGAHVDVLLTYKDKQDGQFTTRVVVEDAIVLSFGGQLTARAVNDAPLQRATETVTLMVLLEDSLRLQTARAVGSITLALRNANDSIEVRNDNFKEQDWTRLENAGPVRAKKGFVSFRRDDGTKEEFVVENDDSVWQYE